MACRRQALTDHLLTCWQQLAMQHELAYSNYMSEYSSSRGPGGWASAQSLTHLEQSLHSLLAHSAGEAVYHPAVHHRLPALCMQALRTTPAAHLRSSNPWSAQSTREGLRELSSPCG